MPTVRKLMLDPTAPSADAGEPAFIARPEGAPVYHGFAQPDLPAIDGWLFGEITPFLDDDSGDAYVIAPDGTRAGLVWEIGDGEIQEILPPEPTRWGVYAVWFPESNSSTEALQRNLRSVLPQLVAAYNRAHGVEG
jgi:hypothetical protein